MLEGVTSFDDIANRDECKGRRRLVPSIRQPSSSLVWALAASLLCPRTLYYFFCLDSRQSRHQLSLCSLIMATVNTASMPQSTSSQRIRAKFLSRIGLHHQHHHPMPTQTRHTAAMEPTNSPCLSTQTPTSPSSVLHDVVAESTMAVCSPSIPMLTPAAVTRPAVNITTETLKYDPLADAHYSKRRRTNRMAAASSSSNKKRLVFQETVRVVPIPMRNEYSSRVRSRLWTSASELYENAARNTVEFAHEGYVLRSSCTVQGLFFLESRAHKVLVLSLVTAGTGARSRKTNSCMFASPRASSFTRATTPCVTTADPTNNNLIRTSCTLHFTHIHLSSSLPMHKMHTHYFASRDPATGRRSLTRQSAP